mmetsp:Transcript_26549/g.74978  ORF Transcript_26549/g.74978 Transcript_26549/m.74978 type:complete len:375 (-) Transcript_26549:93-1217(-)
MGDVPADECRRCKVCFEARRTVVFEPCGHLVCCALCAVAVCHCPICRSPIRRRAELEQGAECDEVDQCATFDPKRATKELAELHVPCRPHRSHLGRHACGIQPEDIQCDAASSPSCRPVRGTIKATGEPICLTSIRGTANADSVMDEIRNLMELPDSDHLVKCYGGCSNARRETILMFLEFMDFGSMADLLLRSAGGGVPPTMLACISRQVVDGVAFLHDRGLPHRGLKPGNIFVNSKGQVKLSEFWIANPIDHGSERVAWPLRCYVAPEQALGEDCSLPVDVWSLGMVVYELATGEYPLASDNFPALFEDLIEKPEPRLDLDKFPRPLCEFNAKCLTRDVTCRPDAATLRRHEYIGTDGVPTLDNLAEWLSSL